MVELLHSGVAGHPPRGSAVIDFPFEKDAGDGGIDCVGESVHEEIESDENDYENEGRPASDRWALHDCPGDDKLATSVADNWRCSVSDDDFNLDFNFDTTAVLLDARAGDDDGYKWGEPAGRDPYMWGEITLTGAPEHLNGEPLIGAKLTIECWWRGDDPSVDV